MSLYWRGDTDGLPSFVTTNTHERRRIFSTASACELLVREMRTALAETNTLLLAYAIMPDHFHAIVVAGPSGLGRTMQLVKGRFARVHNEWLGRRGPVRQSRYHERTLVSDAAFSAAIEYVHLNPVNAGLAESPESYPFSSAHPDSKTDLEEYLHGQASA